MQPDQMKSRMRVQDISLFAHLGCTPAERASRQEVRFSLEVRFYTQVLGEKTDKLEDTLCYAEVVELLRKSIENKEFALVESMARTAFLALKEKFPKEDLLLQVHKVKPPLDELRGGVTYEVGDFFH